jgi:hypothetical protein
MAERQSWISIKQHGLLSTTTLLDLYGYTGAEREAIEAHRRPDSITIRHPAHGAAVVRDQKPMTDSSLRRALRDGLTPEDWYRLLNARVFFWLTEDRLHRLLNAGTYSGKSHDVLMVETRPLVGRYSRKITLSPMNSGNTRPSIPTSGASLRSYRLMTILTGSNGENDRGSRLWSWPLRAACPISRNM